MKKLTIRSWLLTILALTSAASLADPVLVNGAGATFPYPLYSKWFSEYQKVDPTAQFNYQSIGSGGGIKQFTDKTVDFGASDAPMTDEQISKVEGKVLHIPTVLGAVVLTYNLPGVEKGLKLTGDEIADIFLGKITKWNDARIAKQNPTLKLPATDILVAHRSDGSGTSAIFTDYLSKVSKTWKEKVGTGTAVNWPVGLGGKGNEGVTGLVKQSPGAVGYVELIYAEKNNLPFAAVKNKANEYVLPSLEAVTAAADGALKSIPEDFRVSLTDAVGKKSYPISGFTYLLVHQQMDGDKGDRIKKFLGWAITDGQKMAPDLSYAKLPSALVKKVQTKVAQITVKK